jgi:hypothetical protein
MAGRHHDKLCAPVAWIHIFRNFLVNAVFRVAPKSQSQQFSSTIQTTHRLEKILDFLENSAKEYLFDNLGEASRLLQTVGGSVFINIRDSFNAPQFYGGHSASIQSTLTATSCLRRATTAMATTTTSSPGRW